MRLLMRLELVLLIGGAAALVWCALLIANQRLSQHLARLSLAATAPIETSTSPSTPAVPLAIGTPLADLSIPRLHLSAVVFQGSDEDTLRVGVGHIEQTALPGETGNVAIAGHRDTFFRPLRNVQIGDDIFLDTPAARFHYTVMSLRVVGPNEVSVLGPTDDATLTLVTCYPFWLLGNAPDRFIVRATRVVDATRQTIGGAGRSRP